MSVSFGLKSGSQKSFPTVPEVIFDAYTDKDKSNQVSAMWIMSNPEVYAPSLVK